MKSFIFLILIIFSLIEISALCNETQIDINYASPNELDKIIWVGNSTANEIIKSRPFSSIEELVNVKGIGDAKLFDIKNQGLACVGETENSQPESSEQKMHSDEAEELNKDSEIIVSELEEKPNKSEAGNSELNIISLNPVYSKDIKSGEGKEFLKKNLAFSGIIVFCIIFGALFLFKKRKYKNEFN